MLAWGYIIVFNAYLLNIDVLSKHRVFKKALNTLITLSYFGGQMKKPRGKQPTKPNIQKALIKRDMELKGADKAAFTIPIIYRKTFGWEHPGVTFVPINHRGFVIFRGDLDTEEYRRDMYTKIKLDITTLPKYAKNRLLIDDETILAELKEAILTASLKDRYVQIAIPKPKDAKLYECIKKDMEKLVSELGFEYSTNHEGIQCIFKFPKHDIKYYAMESKVCVQSAISSLNYFRDVITDKKFPGAISGIDDLQYNINRLELLMDRYHSDALNIIWDLPNISCPGYFLWIYSCERILDEFLFIAKETRNAIKCLKPEDIQIIGKERDLFGFVWDKAVEKGLEYCEMAVSTIDLTPDINCMQNAFSLVYDYESHREKLGVNQSKFIKLFAGEEKYFKDPNRAQRLLTASFHLNNIFQASERIIVFSTSIVKNTLRIGLFDENNLQN
jgi:hypothetical protein